MWPGSPSTSRDGVVDAEVRVSLVRAGTLIAPRRPGRRTVPESWLHALVSRDPWMGVSLDPERVRALERAVGAWVRTGVPAMGRVRLCLRIVAPEFADADGQEAGVRQDLVDGLVSVPLDELRRSSDPSLWAVELLAQGTDESSLIVSIAQLWKGEASLGETAVEDVLRALGHLDRIAPELGDLLDETEPVWSEVEPSLAVELLRNRLGSLGEAGIAVLAPSWWTQRKRVSARMRVSSGSKSHAAAVSAGLGIEEIVQFRWEAALAGERLTKKDLDQLKRASAAKHTVVRFRGEWVEITPDSLAVFTQRVGATGEASVAELLKASLGLGELGRDDAVERTHVIASGWLGELLDDALHATVEAVPTPETFNGELRPYQERGVGWLGFLGTLGLGSCLADDMGLGKTAQVIASVLVEDVVGPTLVVCPVSVLGNWRSEIERFAPIGVWRSRGRRSRTGCPTSGRLCTS